MSVMVSARVPRELHEQVSEMLVALLESAGVILRCKSPELLGIVEADKAGIITEELGIYSVLIILVSVLYISALVG